MGQIRQGIKYKSSSSGTVTLDPAIAGSQTTKSGHFVNPPLTSRIIDAGAIYIEIYNAGMASSGGEPGLVGIQISGYLPFTIEVGQTWRMEATLDPVTNTYYYCPALIINSNNSMVFYTSNYPA